MRKVGEEHVMNRRRRRRSGRVLIYGKAEIYSDILEPRRLQRTAKRRRGFRRDLEVIRSMISFFSEISETF